MKIQQLYPENRNYLNECQQQLAQAQVIAKKRKAWTVGVAVTTVVLLAAAALLILFFPPMAAVIPFFVAIGSWSPLLVFTAFLPSMALGIASWVAKRKGNEIQAKIDISNNALGQLESARSRDQNTEEMPDASPMKSLTKSTSSKLSNRSTSAPRTIFFGPSTSNINDKVNDQPDRAASLPNPTCYDL